MDPKRIGIIGGSGLYQMEGFEVTEEKSVKTPFGEPSDKLVVGKLGGREVVFLPRHGKGHRYSPSVINYRANICAMKMLGVTSIISISAVGSLKEEIVPGDLVIVDQYIDKTVLRKPSFFDDGIVAHVAFANPVCKGIADELFKATKELGIKAHGKGTYVCMEGPQFSTRAESLLHKGFGAELIGMTNMPEAKLAREAELCYATIALATDYDCWKEGDHVDVAAVIAIMKKNVANAQRVIKHVVPKIGEKDCACNHALEGAIMTDLKMVGKEQRKRIEPIAGRFFN